LTLSSKHFIEAAIGSAYLLTDTQGIGIGMGIYAKGRDESADALCTVYLLSLLSLAFLSCAFVVGSVGVG